jgi:hypothetical protein
MSMASDIISNPSCFSTHKGAPRPDKRGGGGDNDQETVTKTGVRMHRLCTTRILDKVRMDLLGNPRKKIVGDAKGADKPLIRHAR